MANDSTNWGTVAIAAAAFYALYLFFGKRDDSNNSGLIGNLFGFAPNSSTSSAERYINSLTTEERIHLVEGDYKGAGISNDLGGADIRKEGNTFGVSTYQNGPIYSPPNFSVRTATSNELIVANQRLSSDNFAKMVSESNVPKANVNIRGSSSSSKGHTSGKLVFSTALPTSKNVNTMSITNAPVKAVTSNPFKQSFSKSRGYLSTL